MAYVEVWKSGRLVTRRRVDEQRARKGCKVRLGSAGEVRIAIGQSETLGEFEVRMFEGEPPIAHRRIEETDPNTCRWTLSNCVLWGNMDGGDSVEPAQIQGGKMMVNYCCIQGWSGRLGGVGNFGDDPLFVDPDGPDNRIGTEDDRFRLKPGSPCINTGDNSAIPTDTCDLDDDGDPNEPIPFDLESGPRILNGTVDLGAYESG